MADTYHYLLGPHGVFTGTPEEVRQSGYDPWQTQLFTEAMVPEQFGQQRFTWSGTGLPGGADLGLDYAVGYLPALLDLRAAVQGGTASDLERQRYDQMVQAAQAIPLRDVSGLTYDAGTSGTGQTLSGASPDLGGIMLRLADKIDAGQATDQERALFQTTEAALREQNYRASVPQESDAFSPFGDQFFSALAALGGAVGGAAAFGGFAPLAAGAAGTAAAAAPAAATAPSLLGVPLSTLSTIGTLGSYGGTAANLLGSLTGQDWLSKLGLGLGVAGGLAGGAAGIGRALSSGVGSLTDAARLAQSVGRVGGAVGRATGSDALKQASGYLGLAGQLGGGVGGVLGSGGSPAMAAQTAQALTPAGGGRMAWDEWGGADWLDWSGGGQGALLSDAAPGLDWGSFTAGGPGSWAGQMLTDLAPGGGGSLLATLGSLGSGVGKFLGSNASWLGPAASALGSLGTGLLGSNASSAAAAAQSAALNRALDLQTAQWLTQQQQQAPWLEAGHLALGDMTGRAQWAQPTLGQVAPISGQHYALPSPTPGWTPQQYAGYTPTDVPSAAEYAYTPGQGPSAAQYRYTPGQIPAASQYRYTPGAVPTLSGAALLANDPGVQFRLDEGRKALEASAAARGGLTSGATLAALQRQGQELSSQEYANAWQRAAQQAQMREQWGQTASQLGFGQAMSEAQLREQVNQLASQQGWSQAQAEAAFREQLAQQAGQQNWSQALSEAQARAQQQQFGWQAGMQAQQAGQQEARQYEMDLYNRLMQQSQTQYGRDWAQREAENQRLMDAYNALRQGQTTAWNQFSTLAGLGQTATGQLHAAGQGNAQQMGSLLGQLGSANALGQLGPAANWNQAIAGGIGGFQNLLKGLSA